ncbi:hypothetical protein [Bradyrhizobium prioriisuperbiae]|uniref:hypothetical protein n=1 Tax=Bradyrhizobium prioriisuperbiae TaxID=2854389 RepID=UPI0028EB7B16|nr:hypothetical protein [Bradyrhizobium prioritasuperba]
MRVENLHCSKRINPLVNFLIVALILSPSLTIILIPISFLLIMVYNVIRFKLLEPSVTRDTHEKFLQFIGGEPYYMDLDTYGKKGGTYADAVAIDAHNLYVLHEDNAVEIPWSMVRSWTIQAPGADRVVGVGMTAAMTAASHNIEAAAKAHEASGLFVFVADVNHPKWQFRTADTTILRKWNEILTQRNEGLLAA